MTRPTAIPIETTSSAPHETRAPRAFALTEAAPATEFVESHSDQVVDSDAVVPIRRMGWLPRLVWGAASLLLSLAVGLALNALVATLFATNPWLGWTGLALVAIFLIALLALLTRELRSLSRLRTLDHL